MTKKQIENTAKSNSIGLSLIFTSQELRIIPL